MNDLYILYVHLSDWSSMVGRVLVKKKIHTESVRHHRVTYILHGWKDTCSNKEIRMSARDIVFMCVVQVCPSPTGVRKKERCA